MTFADAFAKKPGTKIDLKSFAQALARAGRGQDTMLAHITPKEAEILEAVGGGGTTNPETGLREYGGEPGAGKGGAGEGGPGGGPGGSDVGGGGGSDRGGRASRGDVRGGSRGRGRGRGGTGRGGIGSTDRGKGSGKGSGGFSRQDAPSNVRGGVHGQPAMGRAAIDAANPPADAASAGAPSFGEGVGSGIRGAPGALEAEAVGATTSPLGGDPVGKRDTRIRQALQALTMGALPAETAFDFAQAVGAGLSELGGQSAGTVGPPDPQAPGVTGVAGPSGVPAGGGAGILEPAPVRAPGLQRPGEIPFPRFLGITDAMTPLQQRARIATFGTAGEEGGFRGPEAQDVYRNILLRSILGPQNQVLPEARILPIEAQYAQQVMGADVSPDLSVENFARSLMGLPPARPVMSAPEAQADFTGGR